MGVRRTVSSIVSSIVFGVRFELSGLRRFVSLKLDLGTLALIPESQMFPDPTESGTIVAFLAALADTMFFD